MKKLSKKDLLNMIDQNSQELHQKIDIHHCMMTSLLEEGVCERDLKRFTVPASCSREGRLKEALREAIETLEQTRKAFKSKKLEMLRKKLTQVLIEAE